VGLELNVTRQLLAYADDVSLQGDNTDTVKINTETVDGACKGDGVEANVGKTKYMLLPRHRNVQGNIVTCR
jgi:hypothetical protein